MFDSVRAVMREPLLQFFVAGVVIFLLFEYVANPETTAEEQIVVTSGHIEHLVTLFVKTRQRPPSEVELRGLVDNFILEEVLYREAKAIGLDQDDTIIRRRLKQKMEFLVDDFSAANPSDVDLRKFVEADPERFRADARISFEQFYFSDAESTAVNAVLVSLQNGEPIDSNIASLSGLLPQRFDDASESSVASQFGESFKESLFALEADDWTGPVESPFGMHLIKIDNLVEGRIPALAEIRAVVEREWRVDRRDAAQQAFFDQLRAKYVITIEEIETPSP